MLRKILLGLLILFVLIQFIRPEKNAGTIHGPKSIATLYPVPPQVEAILARSCYDCHSNHTNYPWYTNIQPAGWWMQHHVDEGNEHLNFSEFGIYPPKKMAHKMEEVREMVEKGEMPLESYALIHRDARLSAEDRRTLIEWARAVEMFIRQGA
jgi:hypothetical protein